MSHHGNDPDKIAKNVKINTYHATLFAKFLEKLRATPDGDGSLLDHSLIVYGGGMGNPNQHASDPLPLRRGRRRRAARATATSSSPPRTPIGNLWLSVANQYGSPIDTFGESNGRVDLFA